MRSKDRGRLLLALLRASKAILDEEDDELDEREKLIGQVSGINGRAAGFGFIDCVADES